MTRLKEIFKKKMHDDSARLWYSVFESSEKGKLKFRLTDEYISQDTYMALLNDGWEPVRADSIGTIKKFEKWLIEHHKTDVPDRDQLRREWFDFCEENGESNG